MNTRIHIVSLFWEFSYILLLSVILANYWVGFHLGDLSPLPFKSITYLMAAFCGALIYFFSKSVYRAFFSYLAMCICACFIVGLVLYMPAYLGIVDKEISLFLALRTSVIMFLYIFPMATLGCMAAAYLSPD